MRQRTYVAVPPFSLHSSHTRIRDFLFFSYIDFFIILIIFCSFSSVCACMFKEHRDCYDHAILLHRTLVYVLFCYSFTRW